MTDNLTIKKQFVDAVLADDRATVEKLIHPDFELHQAQGLEYAGTYRGSTGFFKFLEKYWPTYETESLENTNTFVSDDPDILVLEFRSKGVRKSTGRRFDTTVLEVWRFRDSKVVGIAPHWFEQPQ